MMNETTKSISDKLASGEYIYTEKEDWRCVRCNSRNWGIILTDSKGKLLDGPFLCDDCDPTAIVELPDGYDIIPLAEKGKLLIGKVRKG